MNVNIKSYSVDYYGKPIAFVKVTFAIFAFRIKSEVTLVNGVKFEVLSKPQDKDEDIERKVRELAFNAWDSAQNMYK